MGRVCPSVLTLFPRSVDRCCFFNRVVFFLFHLFVTQPVVNAVLFCRPSAFLFATTVQAPCSKHKLRKQKVIFRSVCSPAHDKCATQQQQSQLSNSLLYARLLPTLHFRPFFHPVSLSSLQSLLLPLPLSLFCRLQLLSSPKKREDTLFIFHRSTLYSLSHHRPSLHPSSPFTLTVNCRHSPHTSHPQQLDDSEEAPSHRPSQFPVPCRVVRYPWPTFSPPSWPNTVCSSHWPCFHLLGSLSPGNQHIWYRAFLWMHICDIRTRPLER